MQLPALSLPTLVPHTHSDDLGIELSWQAGHAGLGAEEAVEGLHGTCCHQLQRTRCQERGLCLEPTVLLPQSRLCPGKLSTAATVPHLHSLPLPQQSGQQAVLGSSPFASCISRLPVGSGESLIPSRVQPMGKGSALVIPGEGTLTTWLRVMTRSKVSQQVFTTAAGKQGSTSRSRARTCRVVVASLAPTGAEQPLSLWHPMAKPCPRQSPPDNSGADPWNQGGHSPDFWRQESNRMAEEASKYHKCPKDISYPPQQSSVLQPPLFPPSPYCSTMAESPTFSYRPHAPVPHTSSFFNLLHTELGGGGCCRVMLRGCIAKHELTTPQDRTHAILRCFPHLGEEEPR